MKKAFGIKLLAFALIAISVTACSKYEEGSKFTFLSKKARMVNTWTVSTYTVNDVAQTLGGTITMDLEKDGTATSTWSTPLGSSSEVGTWAFSSDKADLILTDANGSTDTFEIVMLKNKELKLRQVEGVFTTVVTYTGG